MFIVNRRDISWNVLDGEFFLFSAKNNAYCRLNQIGKDIWSIICEYPDGIDIESIVFKLREQYDISDINTVKSDVETFINELVDYGAVILCSEENGKEQ